MFNHLKFRSLTQLMTVTSLIWWRGSETQQFWTWTDENTLRSLNQTWNGTFTLESSSLPHKKHSRIFIIPNL